MTGCRWVRGSPAAAQRGRKRHCLRLDAQQHACHYSAFIVRPPSPSFPPVPCLQGTATRKFFTVVPVVLFLLASHGTDYARQPLGLNLLVVVVLTVAKMSSMHRVRIFGINSD